MLDNFKELTVSDYAAWWGAVIATFAFVWNVIIAIRSGARVEVQAYPNMQIYPPQPLTGDKPYISVRAINRGTSSTTITHFCGYYAPSLWSLIRGKKQSFVVNSHPALGQPIPCVLAPGEEWSNMADQQSMEENESAKYLYIGVVHNQRKKPVYRRVKI